ncbi:MAG: hypothetical protein HZB26_05785 [Candidatus Hydrogenedentes bacterium]|nr:hypothetical protein [Candidatus Hydrogenedentota bacterium]
MFSKSRPVTVTATLISIGLVWSALISLGAGPKAGAVTTKSYKYVDDHGNICFAPSKDAVPESYRGYRHVSHSVDTEDEPSQSISFRDIDGDGENEILVELLVKYSNGRIYKKLEVIKPVGPQFIKLVTVTAERGDDVKLYNLAGDSRTEFYGPIWGGAPEFWVWDDGHYVNIIPEGAAALPHQGKGETTEAALRRLIVERRGKNPS